VPRKRSRHAGGRNKIARCRPSVPRERAAAGILSAAVPEPLWKGGGGSETSRPLADDNSGVQDLSTSDDLRIHAARITHLRAQARMGLEDGAVVANELGRRMEELREGNTPVFSMRAKPAKADQHEDALGSDIARALTGLLTAGRGGVSGLWDAGARLGAILAERGSDLVEQMRIAPLLDDLYAALGIASTAALVELDERVDNVELKMDDVARQRTREELMLLHQRLGELESVMQTRDGDYDPSIDLGGLMGQLSELEARIDHIPWPGTTR
jgi:hypothetical protein